MGLHLLQCVEEDRLLVQCLVYTNQKRLVHLYTVLVCVEGVVFGIIQDIRVSALLSQHDQGRHLDLSTVDPQLVVKIAALYSASYLGEGFIPFLLLYAAAVMPSLVASLRLTSGRIIL